MSELVKVKREGGKGYRLIALASFDPKVHERLDGPAEKAPQPAPAAAEGDEAPSKKGRKAK